MVRHPETSGHVTCHLLLLGMGQLVEELRERRVGSLLGVIQRNDQLQAADPQLMRDLHRARSNSEVVGIVPVQRPFSGRLEVLARGRIS